MNARSVEENNDMLKITYYIISAVSKCPLNNYLYKQCNLMRLIKKIWLSLIAKLYDDDFVAL